MKNVLKSKFLWALALAVSLAIVGCNIFNPTESVNIAGDDADASSPRPFRGTGGFDAGRGADPVVAGARGIPAGALGAPTAILAASSGPCVDDGAEVEPPRGELLRHPVCRRVQLLPRRMPQQGQRLVPGHDTAGDNAVGDGRGGRSRDG